MNTEKDFTTSILVDQSPAAVFKAINNPRAWWSSEIVGPTDKLNEVFDYHFEDIHRCKVKVIELVPGKKVVWQILENDFNFTKDKSEWVNTKVVYEIAEQNGKTQLTFTHVGLVPQYECYEACNQGWTHYIQSSLQKYITEGTGEPNKTGEPQTETEKKLKSEVHNEMNTENNYSTSILVDQSPAAVYAAINNARGWWQGEFEGHTDTLNEEFTYQVPGVHFSKQKVVELIPNKKVVWLVTDSHLTFVGQKDEWTNTKIQFDITTEGTKTKITFTHFGLVPAFECYGGCSGAWDALIEKSLYSYITTGKGVKVF